MIVICEECGKKYRIDPSKIKGAAARFKCRVCTHMIMVSKPQDTPAADPAVDLSVTEAATETASSLPSSKTSTRSRGTRRHRSGCHAPASGSMAVAIGGGVIGLARASPVPAAEHLAAGLGQVRGAGQPVVPGAHDDGVVGGRHQGVLLRSGSKKGVSTTVAATLRRS